MLKMVVPAAAGLLLAALAATNPSETAHTRALVEHAKKRCIDNRFVRGMCGGIASLASLALQYDDHLFFSNARVGDSETLGVLGHVYFLSE